jgi:steroid delta-isomerase-like uncharacterized protein
MFPKRFHFVALATLVAFSACTNPEADQMMADHKAMMAADSTAKAGIAQMKDAVNKVSDMWLSGSTDGIEAFVSADFMTHNPIPGIEGKGIEDLKKMIDLAKNTFTDNKMDLISLTAEGDRATMHYRWRAVNTGSMGEEMPATGKAIDANAIDVYRFQDGKIVEHWGYMEEMKMMEQLGMMPSQ